MKMLRYRLLGSIAAVAALSANGQELELQSLQKNIDIFSGVLEQALELDSSKANGLFGVLGGVDSTYLYGQGVVIEVRTPLGRSRNQMGLAALNSAMKSLQSRGGLSTAIEPPQIANRGAQAPRMSLSTGAAQASDAYSEMIDRLANIDYSLIVNNAIAQASESARALRNLGNVDDSMYEELRIDIDALREDMRLNAQEMRRLAEQARGARTQGTATQDTSTTDDDTEINLQGLQDTLIAKLESLREQATAKATELAQRRDEAEQAYAGQWQADVLEFEAKLYVAMCDYGSTLRELPDTESVSIILTGLGEAVEDQPRRDKLHVFSKSDLLECQAGDIDQAMLQQRSVQYSY
jgi:hypothetical protein